MQPLPEPLCGDRSAVRVAAQPLPADVTAAVRQWRPAEHPHPLLLHQTWSDCNFSAPGHYLGARQRAWRKGCARANPRHEAWLWNDADNRALLATHYPEFLDLYDGYDEQMKRVDMARLFYLFRFGGTYMDLDFACLRPLSALPLAPGMAIFGASTAQRYAQPPPLAL